MNQLVFAEEEPDHIISHQPWKILIVDDEPQVHSITKLALNDFTYEEKKLLFLSAYSAKEALETLKQHDDIAVVLLDVIMETDSAGLDLVKIIRNDLKNDRIRIVISTGQAGLFSRTDVVDNYDINDYREKTELTAERIYVTIRSSLSQYKQIMDLESYIAELKTLQNEAKIKDAKLLLQSRMAQMGEMTNMIAHQWRQPLNALSLVMQKIKMLDDRGILTSEAIDKNIDTAMNIAGNMSKTIDDFMQAVKDDDAKHPFNFIDVIHSVELIMGEQLKKKNINLHYEVDPLLEINSFKNKFFHILINLVSNAADAYATKDIKMKNIVVKASMNDGIFECTVKDGAGGVPESIIDHIFDQYFTTKEAGKGTGLGLDMCKKIVEDMLEGTIDVHNDSDGAVFTIKIKFL